MCFLFFDCIHVVHLPSGDIPFILQSLNATHIPDTLLERLIMGAREFPPVCAVIGGILGQVKFHPIHSLLIYLYGILHLFNIADY